MTIFDQVFPLGLGTGRLPIHAVSSEEEIEAAVNIVLYALDKGVNFIDTAHTYARGMALEVLRRAFQRTTKRPGVTIKTRIDFDRTADDVMRRAEQYLKGMGLLKAKYLYIWSLFSLEEFYQSITPGGLYDGARRLKDEGIVEHICCSSHAKPEETIKIIESGAFEAATISYSLVNALRMEGVLQAAQKHQVGLAAMNPLGGGIIPQNKSFFSFACGEMETDAVQAAMRFVQARPEIQLILSGVTSMGEFDENLESLQQKSNESDANRVKRVSGQIKMLKNFCTGCQYCAGCPAGLPIYEIMQSRNELLFDAKDSRYIHKDIETQQNLQVLGKLERDFSIVFETPLNPCIRCGHCEQHCTQHLSIIDAIADTYRRAKRAKFSLSARKEVLDEILNHHDYNLVGFYPGSMSTQWMLRVYRQFFGEPSFNMVIFDSNPAMWGTESGNIPVHSPNDISMLHPDCIIITSYNYGDEIYQNISHHEKTGIKIVQLYTEESVPWIY